MTSSILRPLYITYDGLLDPLGASQILPYLKGIAAVQRGMVVLSFEKAERTAKNQETMAAVLQMHGIQWKPLRFTTSLGIFGKARDLAKMYFWGARLAIKHEVHAVHTRGHPAAQIGLFIKRLLGAKLIFDFRGLWVDERVDKGGGTYRAGFTAFSTTTSSARSGRYCQGPTRWWCSLTP